MKVSRSLYLLTALAGIILAIIQPYQTAAQSSSWINYSQSYYKISTAENGIHRITFEELDLAAFPVAQVNTANLQLFHRGLEQAIEIVDQGDNRLDPGDYIEFYGKKNDGTLDAALYLNPVAQPHAFHNLYSDTTAYFLTWANGASGKRMPQVSIDPGAQAVDFHWKHFLSLYTSDFSAGRRYPVGASGATYLSQFDYGEGFTGTRIRNGNSTEYDLGPVNFPFTSGPSPRVEILLTGRNEAIHNVEISAGPDGSLRTLGSTQFQFFDNQLFSTDLLWSDLPAGENFKVRVAVTSSGPDHVSVAYIRLSYPEVPNMDGAVRKEFEVEASNNPQSLTIAATSTVNKVYDITDENNVNILGHSDQGGTIVTRIPPAIISSRLLVEQSPIPVTGITRVRFRNIDASRHNYLIVSNKSLRMPAGNYQDPVQSYAAYRSSEQGGAFDTLVVDMDLLYDQYTYGEISPLAIRYFIQHMLTGNPRYLLLIGKGYNVNYKPHRQDPMTATTFNLVPTAGFPGSDVALTAGLGGSTIGAALPTGRINARSPAEVAAYLDKIIEMEATPFNALWRKNLLHLSGGLSQGELVLFKNYMDQFKSVAEGPYLGGQVTTINKQSNETTVLIDVADEVNKGLSLVTFFGHSSTQVTDIEIGKVTDVTLGYDNNGRYPMILVNGCNAGNIFFNQTGFGEDWILAPNKGAIGYLAHTDAGYAGHLKRYSDIFYELAYSDSIYLTKPIGDILLEVGNRYINAVSPDETHIAQVQQEVFQGDPAFSFFPVALPDYETNNENIFLQVFDGASINAQVDSFQVGIITRNFGRTSEDSLNVTVRRTFGDGQVHTYDSVFFSPVSYQDTLYFTIRTNQSNNFGNNQFEAVLDFNQSIDELDETNNSGILNFFIPQGGTVNLSPFDFAIVNQRQPILYSQSSDLLTGTRTFLFEMDTASSFDSPYRLAHTTTGNGLAEWQVSLLPSDSTVYYWRTRFSEPRTGEDTTWTQSSFIFIEDSPEGWSQARFAQFDKNFADGLERNRSLSSWEFASTENQVEITTYGPDHPQGEPANISVTIDGQPFIVSTRLCPDNSVNAIAFDQASTIPYAVLTDGGFDVLDRNRCGRTPQAINTFQANDINSDLKLDTYLDLVPEGDYVILFSIGQVDYSSWGTSTRDQLGQIGVSVSEVDAWQNGEPIIVVGRKGAFQDPPVIIKGDDNTAIPKNEQQISLSHTLRGMFSAGAIKSPPIGPAASWSTLHHQITTEPNDRFTLELLGIDHQGEEQVLMPEISSDPLDLSGIDAQRFPWLRLKLTLEDPAALTPAQLKRWQVIFETLPEGVLLFRGNDSDKTSKIPLLEGQQFASRFTFYNLSQKQFTDSLLVRSTLFNRSVRSSLEEEVNILAPLPGDSVQFTLTIDSREKSGINDYRVFVNPQQVPERWYGNNLNDFQQYIEVASDDTHPILDVTFDGVHILDGDIVSPSPVITVLLKEDNEFSLKQDTVGMELFIRRNSNDCSNCEFQRINFSDPRVRWTEATENSDFQVEYQPEKLEDGIYTLRVQGEDNSGRKSGSEPYTVNFEVINESTITNFYPYPNPFSTSTRFVFTLTGAEIPDQLKIQIMTVTGKVVREITQDEIGVIRIGNNITDYAWDGRDEYGDQLANGVYIYRVLMNRDLDSFKHRETSADKAFKKGYGKLYLLR